MIDDFHSPGYDFLSNFAACTVMLDGVPYATVEHAYQAAKTLSPNERDAIRRAITPGIAKRLGRQVTLRPDWHRIKVTVMHTLLQQKFSREPFRSLLVSTGTEIIIEGNLRHDNEWGSCRCPGCAHRQKKNLLGRLLMRVREDLLAANHPGP